MTHPSGFAGRRACGVVAWRATTRLFPAHPWGDLWDLRKSARYRQYRLTTEFLNERGTAGKAAMTSKVGVFGYFYRGDVIDVMGLCSPEALRFYPPSASDIYDESGQLLSNAGTTTPAAMVAALTPDYLVDSRTYIANLLRPGSPFLK